MTKPRIGINNNMLKQLEEQSNDYENHTNNTKSPILVPLYIKRNLSTSFVKTVNPHNSSNILITSLR